MKHAFLDHHSGIESPIHHLDARAKIIVFFSLILVGVSSQPSSFLLFGLLALALVSIALLARLPLGHLAKKIVVILPFLVLVSLSIPACGVRCPLRTQERQWKQRSLPMT